jgi:hypothetical protein
MICRFDIWVPGPSTMPPRVRSCSGPEFEKTGSVACEGAGRCNVPRIGNTGNSRRNGRILLKGARVWAAGRADFLNMGQEAKGALAGVGMWPSETVPVASLRRGRAVEKRWPRVQRRSHSLECIAEGANGQA